MSSATSLMVETFQTAAPPPRTTFHSQVFSAHQPPSHFPLKGMRLLLDSARSPLTIVVVHLRGGRVKPKRQSLIIWLIIAVALRTTVCTIDGLYYWSLTLNFYLTHSQYLTPQSPCDQIYPSRHHQCCTLLPPFLDSQFRYNSYTKI